MAEVKTGIYLEIKKVNIGTGSTAKSEEYRNFWMTVFQEGESVHCALLNNDFKLTAITEIFPADAFETDRFTYIPQGEKKFQALLRKLLEDQQKKMAVEKKKAAAAPEKEKPANWWDSPKKDVQPGDLFARPEGGASKKTDESSSSGNWWEGPKKDIKPGDLFERPDGDRLKKPADSKKKKNPGVKLKKTWWDS